MVGILHFVTHVVGARKLGGIVITSCLLIVNPSSGNEKAKDYAGTMVAKLSLLFDKVEVKETRGRLDATVFAKEAADAGAAAVFCMGGDGTVNETINGLAQAALRPNFGLIPLGTVNDLARALGIPLNPIDAISMLDTARLAPVDIGRVNDKYFANGVAIGTLSEAVADVSAEEKTRLGTFAYFFKGIKAINAQRLYRFDIETDAATFCVESSLLVIALTNSLGSFERFMPAARVADGKLRLVVFKKFDFIGLLNIVSKLLIGKIGDSAFVKVTPFKREIGRAHV